MTPHPGKQALSAILAGENFTPADFIAIAEYVEGLEGVDNSADTESPDSPTQLRALAADKVACTYAYGRDLRKAAAEIERLREALSFYATNWRPHCGDHGVPIASEPNDLLRDDWGDIARTALSTEDKSDG